MGEEVVFSVIILGDTGVGKSCILLRFSDDKFNEQHNVTIGVEFGTKHLNIGSTKIKLQIWDTAGQESFRSITRTFYRRAEGVLLVYDATARHTFDNLEHWIVEIRQNCPSYAVIYLVGNQIDLISQNPQNREVTEEEGKAFMAKYGISGFKETSARSGFGVNELLNDFCMVMLSQLNGRKDIAPPVSQPVVLVPKKNSQSKKCC